MGEVRKLGTLISRELVGELRTREVVTATLVFPPLVLVIFRFSFDLAEIGKIVDWKGMTPGILWTALAFSGLLSLSRSFAMEKDDDRWLGLLLAPVDRGTLYLAKMSANLLYLILVALVTVPIFAIFFPEVSVFVTKTTVLGAEHTSLLPKTPNVMLVVLLGLIGIAGAGSLMSAMAVNTRAREALLPLLMLPVLAPVLIAATQGLKAAINGLPITDLDGFGRWLLMLAALDVMFVSVGWLLFEFVVEE